jgi:hypothetical protein
MSAHPRQVTVGAIAPSLVGSLLNVAANPRLCSKPLRLRFLSRYRLEERYREFVIGRSSCMS